jgi:flagellar biosynthesis protein FliP
MKILTITTNNYESFFLLYVDNELTELEKQEVESFVKSNPALSVEFVALKQTKLHPEQIIYANKHFLYKQEEEVINAIHTKQEGNVTSKDTFTIKWYHLAAAVSIGIILLITNFTKTNLTTKILKTEIVNAQPKPNSGNQSIVQNTDKSDSVLQDLPKNKTSNTLKNVQLYNSESIAENKIIEVPIAEQNLSNSTTILPLAVTSTENQRQNISQIDAIQLNNPIITQTTIEPIIPTRQNEIEAETVVIKPQKGLRKLKAFINKIDNQIDVLTSIEPSANERSIKVAAFTIPFKKIK